MTSLTQAAVAEFVAAIGADRTRLLDVALAVQRRFGYISNDAVAAMASGLGLHAVEVEDTVSFYAFLDRVPRGEFRIRLSRTPISLMKGAAEIAAAFAAALGVAMGGTTADRKFTLEWTNDIGMADQEPAALINSAVLTGLTAAEVRGLSHRCGRGPAARTRFPWHRASGPA